ncbi:MAG: hypothetical protein OXI64_13550 [Defluviicoccus sp.]|nr:hypothetical protein [Defluviicoccus sp.]
MAEPGGGRRRQRCVMASDAEWARMRETAREAGLSCSEFIVRRCLEDGVSAAPEPFLPAPAMRRVARAVLVLEALERRRLENEGAAALWERETELAEGWLDGEAGLG